MTHKSFTRKGLLAASATISLILLLSLSTAGYSLAETQNQKPKEHTERLGWRIKTRERHGLNFTVGTDLFTVKFAGSLQVPKFQFWYNVEGENNTVYQVFFHKVFEFNDTDGDGAYNKTSDKTEAGRLLSLPSADMTLVGPENITGPDGSTLGVRFNFTMSAQVANQPGPRKEQTDTVIILQCSMFEQDYAQSKGISYNVTGGAELKIDVIIERWPFMDNDNLLGLVWSINNQDLTLEPSLSNSSVTLGRGYFSWVDNATIYNATQSEQKQAKGSFDREGRTAFVYLTYPNFQNKSLIHDPSIGVRTTVPNIPGSPEDMDIHDYLDISPRNLVKNIVANRTQTFFFRNYALMLSSAKELELNVTVDSKVVTRYLSLVVEPGQSVSLQMQMNVTPPSGVVTIQRTLNFYLDIEPGAVIPLKAKMGVFINKTALEGELRRTMNISRLTWAYWNRTRMSWVPVESHLDNDGYLICNTTHFSTWTIMETVPLRLVAQIPTNTVTQGDKTTISATLRDDANNPVEAAAVLATLGSTSVRLLDKGNGAYEGVLDTSTISPAAYAIVITATKGGYISDQGSLTLNIQPAIPWMTYAIIGLAITGLAAASVAVLMRRR